MSAPDHFDADCQALAEALRQRAIDKPQRRVARDLLRRAFLLSEAPDAGPADAFREVHDAIRALLGRDEPAPWQPLGARLADWTPVRIQGALNRSFADRLERTYTATSDRLEEVVEWFWERCRPDEEKARAKTAEEMAIEEFDAQDMEYVWGKKRRSPPSG